MPRTKPHGDDPAYLLGLSGNKYEGHGLQSRYLRRLLRLLPPRERYLLRLFYVRGASQRELAGLLGVSLRTVQRSLRRARERALDPLNQAIVACWRRLGPEERRLACLHRLMGMSLPEIARMGLVRIWGAAAERPATLMELRSMFRRIERRVRRAERRRRRQGAGGPGGGSSDPSGPSDG